MSTLGPFIYHPAQTALAFRGYNVANLGRTAELLAHPLYGPTVEEWLDRAGRECARIMGRPVDLPARVREGRETKGLDTYQEDVALIVGAEMAQIKLLEKFFHVGIDRFKLAFGYSLGEPAALVATGVYELEPLLGPPLTIAGDCVALSHDVTMGVLFSKGRALDLDAIDRRLIEINQRGEGVIGVSSKLSPNTVLLLGQNETVPHFGATMIDIVPEHTRLRLNSNRWPPLHTPIVWQRNVTNRAACLLQRIPGGLTAPAIPVLCGSTGKASYSGHNSRALLTKWVDHPQLLWEMVYETLASGVNTVVHVGPDPNLIVATFQRLADNVTAQLANGTWTSLGLRAISRAVRRPWLRPLLSSRTALLRAPFLKHVVLEDWLIENAPAS